jgi:hypothetical protein
MSDPAIRESVQNSQDGKMPATTEEYWSWRNSEDRTSCNIKEVFSEYFDTDDFSNIDTLVREVIQNSLDAGKKDSTDPIVVTFSFGKASNDPFLKEIFSSLRSHRSYCPKLSDDKLDSINWLQIKDSNTTGLKGALHSQNDSNFWKFLLEFGSGTKPEGGLGRHGVGRISMILASKIHTVLVATIREGESTLAVSGIALLDPVSAPCPDGTEKKKVPQSLLVGEYDNISDTSRLHSEDKDFVSKFRTTFDINNSDPGLAVFVLNPHKEITADKIKAAAIEHFASAIYTEKLIVKIENGD